MEEDKRKQGMLYLQQQRFGKKWKRVWCVLYRESSCSISRLEFYECKDGGNMEKNDKTLRKQQDNKKVIRLADCIRVAEAEMDGCPRDTAAFLVETTEKMYVFAAERNQLEDWTHKLCETAFPMNWADHGVKRGSLQRGNRVEEDQGMEDNMLYSGRETVRDFRVCVRKSEASDRCRLKGDGFLRADTDALHLLDRSGDVLYTWPYRYLRRFGRDKSTFSFEAGRRCDSGEGSFEFDTKHGNLLFQAVEAAIHLQKVPPPRQSSGGGRSSPDVPQNQNLNLNLPPPPPHPLLNQSRTPPLPQPRLQQQAADGVYSMVTEAHLQVIHHKEKESSPTQQRPPLSRLEPPGDKVLTGVKSLTLDTRGLPAPQKNQVKMISSCPLPQAGPDSGPSLAPGPGSAQTSNPRVNPKLSSTVDQTYSQISLTGSKRSTKRDKRGGASSSTPPVITQEPDYSLPFDTIANNVITGLLTSGPAKEPGADPLYDSIDEMKIRNVFLREAKAADAVYGKVDHIYDEPEGCAAATGSKAASVYDDPEEMRGGAWRIMGTVADPKGHEYPYNPRMDDYAVPKRAQRALPVTQSANQEEEGGDGEEEDEESEDEEEPGGEQQDSPYNNVMLKIGAQASNHPQ